MTLDRGLGGPVAVAEHLGMLQKGLSLDQAGKGRGVNEMVMNAILFAGTRGRVVCETETPKRGSAVKAFAKLLCPRRSVPKAR